MTSIKIIEKLPKNLNEYESALKSGVFNNLTTYPMLVNLPIEVLNELLRAHGLPCAVENENGTNTDILIKKRYIHLSITEHVSENYEQFQTIKSLSMDLIQNNSSLCKDQKKQLVDAYKGLRETTFYDKSLNIKINELDPPLLTFLQLKLPNLTSDPLSMIQSMATDLEGSLTLSHLILEYTQQTQPPTSPSSNHQTHRSPPHKKQTQHPTMDVDDEEIDLPSMYKERNTPQNPIANFPPLPPSKPPQGFNTPIISQHNLFNHSNISETSTLTIPIPAISTNLNVGHNEELTGSQTLQILLDSLTPSEKKIATKLLFIRIGTNNREIISINLENCHLLTYMQFKQQALKTPTVMTDAAKLKITDEQIPARITEEQTWLFQNEQQEHLLIQHIITQLKNNKCKLLRKTKIHDTSADPCHDGTRSVNTLLITAIPATIHPAKESSKLVHELFSKLNIPLSIADSATIDSVDLSLPIQSTDPNSSYMLLITLLCPVAVPTLSMLIETTQSYTVAYNNKGSPIRSTVTVALNSLPPSWSRQTLVNAITIAAIRGTSLVESPIIADHIAQSLRETFPGDDLVSILVPVHTIFSVVKQQLPLRIKDTVPYFLLLAPESLTMEETSNIQSSLGLEKNIPHNVIRIQWRHLEIRKLITAYDKQPMPRKVFEAQECCEIIGIGNVTSKQIFDELPPHVQLTVAYIKILPRLVNSTQTRELGTHKAHIVLKPLPDTTPRTRIDTIWFMKFRHPDGGRLCLKSYWFGAQETHKQSQRPNQYNIFTLSAALSDNIITWKDDDSFAPMKMVQAHALSASNTTAGVFLPPKAKKKSNK